MAQGEPEVTPVDVVSILNRALEGHYHLEREVGAGGMATVYLAEDLKHHRQVAIKVLRHDVSASVGAERFLREIEIAAQLQHPNILPLLDSGAVEGFVYYVMPFVEGPTLGARLRSYTCKTRKDESKTLQAAEHTLSARVAVPFFDQFPVQPPLSIFRG